MGTHSFLLQPGCWLGKGIIQVIGSSNQFPFYTKWEIVKLENERIFLEQQIEIQGSESILQNNFCITNITSKNFSIEITNEYIEKAKGHGTINSQKIYWEFKSDLLKGFECFELLANGDYSFHSEYLSSDFLYGTIINGNIWLKTSI